MASRTSDAVGASPRAIARTRSARDAPGGFMDPVLGGHGDDELAHHIPALHVIHRLTPFVDAAEPSMSLSGAAPSVPFGRASGGRWSLPRREPGTQSPQSGARRA